MFELIRKIVKDAPLEVRYVKSLETHTVLYKNIAILHIGEKEECEGFIKDYNRHLLCVNQGILRIN